MITTKMKDTNYSQPSPTTTTTTTTTDAVSAQVEDNENPKFSCLKQKNIKEEREKIDKKFNDTEFSPSSSSSSCLTTLSTSSSLKETDLTEKEGRAPECNTTRTHSSTAQQQHEQKEPTFFSDEKGNLKFVNIVVKYPCTIFWTFMILCIVVTIILVLIVFGDGSGIPFSDPKNGYDIYDVRSVEYDSFRLARDKVRDTRYFNEKKLASGSGDDKNNNNEEIQSKSLDLTYWVFEGETTDGVFGSAESIQAMKDAFDLFMEEEQYDQYCKLDYEQKDNTRIVTTKNNKNFNNKVPCELPTTPLIAYYASSWDNKKVAAVIEQLKVLGNVQLFNKLSLCYLLGQFCELIPEDTTPEDISWTIELGENITDITKTWDMMGDLVEDFHQVTELASYLIQVDIYRGTIIFGYDTNFSAENPVSMFSRGILFWGGPLNVRGDLDQHNYTSTASGFARSIASTKQDEEKKTEQDEGDLKDYILDNLLEEMDALAKADTNTNVNSYYLMGTLYYDILSNIVVQDALLGIISLLFVFIWLRINTGSFFLASVGIFEICFSIPIAWFLFTVVFQIEYFSFFNALSIFIVAAIGADDIFIFMDAYKQSKYRNPDNLLSLETRMSWVYRRTGAAMAITSATTSFAFLCNLITPLVEIQSFGIFAACVIFIDYVLVMSLFCTAVVIYHDRYEDRKTICGCINDCSQSKPSPTETAHEALRAATADEGDDDRVSAFFRTKVTTFIQIPLHRIVIGVIFVAWISTAAWQTSKLEPTKETERFLDEDHPLQKSFTIFVNEFPTADIDEGLKIYYTWGLDEVNREGVNLFFDPEFVGDPVFLDTFDFNEQCQTELVKACTKLKTDKQYEPYIKRKGGVASVFCFVEELAAFNVRGNLDDCDYVEKGLWKNETWQIAPEDLSSVFEEFVQQRSCRDQTKTIMSQYNNELGWDGSSIRYASVSVESENLDIYFTPSQSYTRSQYNAFASIAEELDNVVSECCTGHVIMTDLNQRFVFMNTQHIYAQSAVESSILGVGIAFTVLLLATRVFHVAFFASLSIASVLVSVTGMMVMLGWSVGSVESVLISIIAGFSVDYVVHLAHAFATAEVDDEEKNGNPDNDDDNNHVVYQRIRAAFGDMGISVLNGMITSVGASIPLFFCQVRYFSKFGTFLCLTISFSWIFANFVFMTLLAQLKIPIKHGNGFRY